MKEELLIAGLKRQDKIVFDFIFNYYYSGLCAFSMQYIKDREAVEDLVQDFFVNLWINSVQLQIRQSLKSYLFASIKNRCLDAIKHSKVHDKFQNYMLVDANKSESSIEAYFAESELRQAIQACMIKLPPRCREIFELSRLSGLSNQEISEKLSISKRTVELQISNSLKVLRTELTDFLPLYLIFYLLK